ncbi:MAG TPA: fibronectin type III domain-containing protein [Polyangiaceae bacterium]
MTTTTKTVSRPRVSLNLPRRVADLIAFANRVVTDLTGNKALPSPTPTLAVILAAISALVAAQSAALTRAAGTATVRNEKRDTLVMLLRQLAACVQAAADASPENAASLIESTGMAVRKEGARVKRTFSVEQGEVSGSVTVQAAVASKRAAYDWEYSTDGGKTWTAAPTTLQSRTTVSGLGAGTTAQFRYRVATKGGAGDWSQPTSFLVK